MSLQGITGRGYLAVTVVILATIGVLALAALDPILGTIAGFVLAVIASIGNKIFKYFGHALEHFAFVHVNPHSATCRMLLVGLGRSGKTSIIKRFLTVETPKSETSTVDFDVYEETKRIGLQEPHRYLVSIADYQGQKPSQIMVNSPVSFFGYKGNRLINALIFVADPFPEIVSAEGKVLEGEALLTALSQDTLQLIQKRIESQLEYVTKYTIELVFSAAYSPQNLFAVRFLINKTDLLREVVTRGYLPEVTLADLETFIINKYSHLITKLKQACYENDIEDFSIHLVSAHTGENIQEVLSNIVEKYHRRSIS